MMTVQKAREVVKYLKTTNAPASVEGLSNKFQVTPEDLQELSSRQWIKVVDGGYAWSFYKAPPKPETSKD